MKVKVFMPKYMSTFKCIGTKCTDTCCLGWDINIDLNTYKKYNSSSGEFKKLLYGKFKENINYNDDFFNKGFMILKDGYKCPFLNHNMLCDIHGNFGEENLCITCKNYPRTFNIVDDIYEKSALASCPEVCNIAFLNKEKMEFIEEYQDLDVDNIQIKRIIDVDAFEESDSIIKYFWEIRVASINILQFRELSIEQRLTLLLDFYNSIENLYKDEKIYELEDFLEDFNENLINYTQDKLIDFKKDINFFINVNNDYFKDKIKNNKLKNIYNKYKLFISDNYNIDNYLKNDNCYINNFNSYNYIIENYLVNQIFKDLIPFNKGTNLKDSLNELINIYKIIKTYTIAISIVDNKEIDALLIINVIQALSKDTEHNTEFRKLLNSI